MSGEEIAAVTEDVTPVSLSKRGNYAVSVAWSDGHRGGIYSYEVLRKVAEAVAVGGEGTGTGDRGVDGGGKVRG